MNSAESIFSFAECFFRIDSNALYSSYIKKEKKEYGIAIFYKKSIRELKSLFYKVFPIACVHLKFPRKTHGRMEITWIIGTCEEKSIF